MADNTISNENIKELLYYLNNVKLIDKLRILQVDVVILVTWALLVIIASFSETFLNISTGADFTVIIWITTLIFGGVLTIFLKEQVYLTFRPKFSFIEPVFIFTLVSGVLIAIIFDYLIKLNEVIFPLYSIIIGIYSFSLLRPYYTNHSEVFKKNMHLFVPIICLLSGIVNITVAILEEIYPDDFLSMLGGQQYAAFQSLVFTIFISPAMLFLAWYNHKQINIAIENIEINE